MGKSDGYDKNAPWCVPRGETRAIRDARRLPAPANFPRRDNGYATTPPTPRELTARCPPRSSPFSSRSPLGTGTRLLRVGGELVVLPHRVKPTGFKAPNAYGSKVVFDGETTNAAFQREVRAVGEGVGPKKKLVPYHPLAARNRPKSQVENVVGSRFAVPKGSVERYRNSSQVDLSDGHPESRAPWRTTNQTYAQPKHARKIGMDNTGIFAESAQRTHSKQRF